MLPLYLQVILSKNVQPISLERFLFSMCFIDQEVPDETWSLLVETSDGNQIDPPYLAVRRFVDSKRMDYITDVSFP